MQRSHLNRGFTMDFWNKIENLHKINRSSLVIGLDPVIDKLPENIEKNNGGILKFIEQIVNSTHDLVCAYKPNLAFFLALGDDGLKILRQSIEIVKSCRGHTSYGDIPVILDAKFNDVGHTAEMYSDFAYNTGADAVTINPYIGRDTIAPFIENGLGIILLCATSNPNYTDVEGIPVGTGRDGKPLYSEIARLAEEWSRYFGKRIGLVVGATHPDVFARIRKYAPNSPFLIPGIGAQGGDIADSMKSSITADSFPPLIVSARSILYAASDENFADAAREKAIELKNKINSICRGNTSHTSIGERISNE